MQLRAPSRLAGIAVVLAAPLLGVLVLRAPLLNNLAYRDPWFYSGYGWTLAHHIEVFGWFYYSVRFPVTLPIRWFTEVFGPVTGALVLRYVILAGTGAVLYVCVRRFASVWVAGTAVLLLAINPFYVRMVLWDYTSYVALPCAIAGIALWFMASTRGSVFGPFVGSGALLGASVFANALSAIFVVPLLMIEGIAALRRGPREIARLAARCASATLGAALVFIGGYAAYRLYLGGISPKDLVKPTIDFARSNDQFSAPFQRSASEFLDGEPRVYAPPLLALAAVVLLGRRLVEDSLRGRVAQYAVAYITILWVYRFAVTSSVVETWWAYNMAAITMAFAVPVVLDRLEHISAERHVRALLGSALLGAAAATIAIRNRNDAAVRAYEHIRDNVPALLAGLVIAVALVVGMRVLRHAVARCAVTFAFFALVAVVSLMPARYIGIAQTGEFAPDGRSELWGYQAAYDMAKLIEATDQPDSRTLLWATVYGLPIIQWTNLPHQGGGIYDAEAPPRTLEVLAPGEVVRALHPTTDEVLLLSNEQADMNLGVGALRRRGMDPVVRRRGAWAHGYLHYALVDLTRASR